MMLMTLPIAPAAGQTRASPVTWTLVRVWTASDAIPIALRLNVTAEKVAPATEAGRRKIRATLPGTLKSTRATSMLGFTHTASAGAGASRVDSEPSDVSTPMASITFFMLFILLSLGMRGFPRRAASLFGRILSTIFRSRDPGPRYAVDMSNRSATPRCRARRGTGRQHVDLHPIATAPGATPGRFDRSTGRFALAHTWRVDVRERERAMSQAGTLLRHERRPALR